MTNYEYILNECKRAHYGAWSERGINDCVGRLSALTREELLRLLTSRWLEPRDEVRKAAVRIVFQQQLAQREAKIKEATIEDLGAMLTEKDGNYVKMARQELKKRYLQAGHDVQMQIIAFFKKGNTKQDRKWGEVREKWQQRGFANPPSIFDTWQK